MLFLYSRTGTNASSAGPKESRQNGVGICGGVCRLLLAQPHIYVVVLQQSQFHGGVQHILARITHCGFLLVLQQLVHQSHCTLPS